MRLEISGRCRRAVETFALPRYNLTTSRVEQSFNSVNLMHAVFSSYSRRRRI
jgi:hypothetical protein